MHAYQSYIYNKKVNDEIQSCKDKETLKDKKISLEIRNNKHMKGDTRKIIETARDIQMTKEQDSVVIMFTLSPSCYATMALREVIGDAVFYTQKQTSTMQ